MRAVFALFLTAGLALCGLAPAASAQTAQVVYWQGAHAPRLNAVCPAGSQTTFIAELRVQKGERIGATGSFTLHLQGGRDKTVELSRVNRRLAEAYVLAGPRAKVATADPTLSYAFPVELSQGATPRIRLMRACMSATTA